MDYTSIKVKKYKLFEEVKLSDLKRINVIIGKNNSGKSSLIDVIAAAYDIDMYKKIERNDCEITASTIVTKAMSQAAFGGYSRIDGWDSGRYAEAVVGKEIDFNILGTTNSIKVEVNSSDDIINELKGQWTLGLRSVENSIKQNCFRRMSSERNIIPESSEIDELSETGEGASNLIRKIILESNYDESLIEEKLLNSLNLIFYPDGKFESIRIQQISGESGGIWEVFLKEKGQRRIQLSKMGSGLKTIILVLLNLIVIPEYKNKKKEYIFAFEEIENNLHPALQRRIFDYLYDYAINEKTTIYITTHSHVAINCFFDKEQASLYHIEKTEGKAVVKRIESYLDKAEILSDLDVKASDLLQSNGIIWVEGPSDRIYLKKWFELFTDNEFIEGNHYQFLYYGGKLLSHYAAKEETNLISILTTNRNAAIIIDSDKKNKQASINMTKKRIEKEFNDLDMFSWITKGKEIENYIPADAARKMFDSDKIKGCGQYELFPQYIEKYYKNFSNRKVAFANEIVSFLSRENSENIMDLQKKIKEPFRFLNFYLSP